MAIAFGTFLAALLVACGGGTGADKTPTPAMTVASTALSTSPVAEVTSTPRPTSTPYAATEPPASGRVRTTFSVRCDMGAFGPEIHVGYDIAIVDTDEPAATLTGVKLYIDGVLQEDNSPLSTKTFVKQSTFGGVPRKVHAVELHVETWAAPQPKDIIEFAACPAAPGKPVA